MKTKERRKFFDFKTTIIISFIGAIIGSNILWDFIALKTSTPVDNKVNLLKQEFDLFKESNECESGLKKDLIQVELKSICERLDKIEQQQRSILRAVNKNYSYNLNNIDSTFIN